VNNAVSFGKGTLDMSVNGNDPGQNNFQMDGVAVNNVANRGSAGDFVIYAGIGLEGEAEAPDMSMRARSAQRPPSPQPEC
jgi:hypothetical protein